MAKYFYFLCVLLISVSLIILGFTSCSGSNTIATSSSRRTSTSRNTSSSSSDDKEKDDGEPCRDSDSCEETCKDIYDAFAEANECMDEGRDKVGRLDKVFKHLKSGKYNELLDISEEDNDVDMDDFEDYLEIGATGWTDLIEGWGAPDKVSERAVNKLNDGDKLTDTLKWIIDKTNVAEVLQDSDDGLDVLETLLMEFDDYIREAAASKFNPKEWETTPNKKNIHSGDGNGHKVCTANAILNYHTGLMSSTVNKLYIWAGENGSGCSREVINFDSDSDRRLYRGLAFLSLDGEDENIFSYSADQNNDVAFNMAYTLLNKACTSISGTNENRSIACKRALFCWMKIRNSSLISSKLEGWLDGQSGLGSFDIDNANDCKPAEFYDLLH